MAQVKENYLKVEKERETEMSKSINYQRENEELESDKEKLELDKAKLKQDKEQLESDKEKLNILLDTNEKDYQAKMESLKREEHEHYLEMERKYRNEMDEGYEEIARLKGEIEGLKGEGDKFRKSEKELRDEIEFLGKKNKRLEGGNREF